MSKGKIKCHSCEVALSKEELIVQVDTDADEGGVYVVRYYACPHCREPIADGRLKSLGSYPAPSADEPLRWEN